MQVKGRGRQAWEEGREGREGFKEGQHYAARPAALGRTSRQEKLYKAGGVKLQQEGRQVMSQQQQVIYKAEHACPQVVYIQGKYTGRQGREAYTKT